MRGSKIHKEEDYKMKIMRKLLAGVLTTTTLFASFGVNAEPNEARYKQLHNLLEEDTNEIHVIYNDKVIDSDVSPINDDGHVLIPFRAALEGLGATVLYDDDTKQVKAEKDDIDVSFKLLDTSVNVYKDGYTSVMNLETPMQVIDGYTLVPIRLFSEAFGLDVDWDGDKQAVIITSLQKFNDDLQNVGPNISKLSEMKNVNWNEGDFEFNVTLSIPNIIDDANVSGTASIKKDSDKISIDVNANIATSDFSISDCNFNVITVDNKEVYFKSNIRDKIPKDSDVTIPDFVTDSWAKIDIEKYINEANISESEKEELQAFSNGNIENINYTQLPKLFMKDTSLFISYGMAIALDMQENLNNYCKVSQNTDGSITATLDISTDESKVIADHIFNAGTMIQTLDIHSNMKKDKTSYTNISTLNGSINLGFFQVNINSNIKTSLQNTNDISINIPEANNVTDDAINSTNETKNSADSLNISIKF